MTCTFDPLVTADCVGETLHSPGQMAAEVADLDRLLAVANASRPWVLTGKLTPMGHCPIGGRTSRHFIVDPTGVVRLVDNQSTNDEAVFRADPSACEQNGNRSPD